MEEEKEEKEEKEEEEEEEGRKDWVERAGEEAQGPAAVVSGRGDPMLLLWTTARRAG